jgi:ribosomal protein S18 acetylase RimI-like enzyme
VFASIELGARIDRAEANLSAAIGTAVQAQDPHGDAFVEQIGGGVAVYTGPASPMNKMIGVGFDGVPDEERLREIEELFRIRDAPLQAEVATLAAPAFAAVLSRRGYVLENFENVLGRPLTAHDAEAPLDPAIDIRLMNSAQQAEEWLDAAIRGFQHADGQGVQATPLPPRKLLEQSLRPYAKMRGFRRYSAYIDGYLAGVASLRLDNGLAQLCGAATLPLFRRRGVQTMLLRRRLGDAVREGCELAVMMTQPGSKSQQNGYGQGFLLLYSRAILVKTPAG